MKYTYWNFYAITPLLFLGLYITTPAPIGLDLVIAAVGGAFFNVGQNLTALFNLYAQYLTKKTEELNRRSKNEY